MTQEKEETIARRQVHPDANGWRQNHADANGWKPIHLAAKKGSVPCLKVCVTFCSGHLC